MSPKETSLQAIEHFAREVAVEKLDILIEINEDGAKENRGFRRFNNGRR
jgi:hypothetical protein